MLRKLVFFGMILVLMASFAVVLADQDGNDRYCNSDQYGCWVTGDDGEQIYIVFWSESAREYFMGPGSNAPIADPFPAGQMSLPAAPAVVMVKDSAEEKDSAEDVLTRDQKEQKIYDYEYNNMVDYCQNNGGCDTIDMGSFWEYIGSCTDEEVDNWLLYWEDYDSWVQPAS